MWLQIYAEKYTHNLLKRQIFLLFTKLLKWRKIFVLLISYVCVFFSYLSTYNIYLLIYIYIYIYIYKYIYIYICLYIYKYTSAQLWSSIKYVNWLILTEITSVAWSILEGFNPFVFLWSSYDELRLLCMTLIKCRSHSVIHKYVNFLKSVKKRH